MVRKYTPCAGKLDNFNKFIYRFYEIIRLISYMSRNKTAVLCGVSLSLLCFVKIMLVDRMLMGNTDISTLTAAVVCATMAVTVLIAKLVGCTLPMTAKKLGFDPAVMASPFITTIVDALSLLVYFGIASALLFQ